MGLIIFGSRQVPIDMEEFRVYCPSCETQTETEVYVFSRYYHLYWIPVFPVAKHATTQCTHCGLKTTERSFDDQLISNYGEIKARYKHPWYTYSLSILFPLLVVGFVLGS